MPGAKTTDITASIASVRTVQEEVSKWGTKLSGIKTANNWQELLNHFSGIGHLEILGLPELSKGDPNSFKTLLTNAVIALNNTLVASNKAHQTAILKKDTEADQMVGVKAYARAVQSAVEDFKKTSNVKALPDDVQKAYNVVIGIANT